MSRGGFVPCHLSVVLDGDGFADVSAAALGAWLRLRCLGEFTGQAVRFKALERRGVSVDMLAELVTAGIATETDGAFEAIGMPGIPRKPSDEPEEIRGRVARFREREKQREKSDPIRSNPIQGNAVTRYGVLHDGEDEREHDHAYLRSHGLCLRCRQPAAETNPLTSAGMHRFPDCQSLELIP
jgi:hypothetical protein